MSSEFRLLGDLEVRVDGRPIGLGHPRQCRVLTALLVEANKPVPVDELIDRVWGQRHPDRARETLYSYVSKLRHALLAARDVSLARQSGGYLLSADPAAIDLNQFGRLIAEARSAHDERALDLFTRALEYWRGEALAGMDGPWFNDIRSALNRERFEAELDRNDVALRCGQHSRLLPEMHVKSAAFPLDERLAGQLMLAFYRSGRQAEALSTFENVRRQLAAELGIDPGQELRALQAAVLRADPEILGSSPRGTVAPNTGASNAALRSTTPRQLPPAPWHFTGRTDEINALTSLLDQRPDTGGTVIISAIGGMAGIGKTALAVHWAQQVAHRFPDGQLYTNLRGHDPGGQPVAPAEAVCAFLEALGVQPPHIPADLPSQSALYRSVLADKQVLVLLDNARDADQVRPLLPGSATCLVLVTSRSRLTSLVAAEGAHPLALDLLTATEARDLLARRLGPERVAAEPGPVSTLIELCARLPLALNIAAARAATYPRQSLAAVVGHLQNAEVRLDALSAGDTTSDLRAVLSWSYRNLSPAAARMFRLLGTRPGPDISLKAAASLAAVARPQALDLVEELTRTYMLTEHSPGRYTFHDLLRAYAAEKAWTEDTAEERQAANRRVLDHYAHTAHCAATLLSPSRGKIALLPPTPGATPEAPADYDQAWAWFEAEHRVLLTSVVQAVEAGFDPYAWQIPSALMTFLDRAGHWQELASSQKVALAAARRLADRKGQAGAHRGLGRAFLRLGSYEDSHEQLRHALDLYRQLDDRVGQAHTHHDFALVYEQQVRYRDALDHARRVLELFHAEGHPTAQANALNTVGWYHAMLEDYQAALACCQQALDLYHEVGDAAGEAGTWDSLGYAHFRLGRYPQAVTSYQQAIKLYQQVGDRYYQAGSIVRPGDTHEADHDPGTARETWRQALSILTELDHPDADLVRQKLEQARSAATDTADAAG